MSEEKPDLIHEEGKRNIPMTEIGLDPDSYATAATLEGHGLYKSRFDKLSIPRTLWVFKKVVLVILSVYTGYLCEGFELGAGGSIIANDGFIKQFGDQSSSGSNNDVRALNTTWVSSWSALLNVGQIVTFTYVSWLADRFGRKASFYVAWLWLVVGLIFLNVAKSPSVWALGKLCNGAGIGVLQITCQVYVMEVCPNRIRGGAVTFQSVWSNFGGIIVAVMMQQLNQKHPENYLIAMRILWAPIGFIILCWIWIPESPWFHVRRGNNEKAMKSLKSLFGGVKGYDFEEELAIIQNTVAHEREMLIHAPTYMDCLRGLNLRRTLTVMILAVAQQFAGLVIISTYSTYFFSLVGLKDPFLGSLILSCCNLLAILIWSLTTDKLGRRLYICCCETFVCGILLIVGGLNWSGATGSNTKSGTALLVICCLWTMSFQIIGQSYYVYSAELPSAELRIRTGPITFLTNSITGIATCYATPPMLVALTLKSGFIYFALSVPCCILIWLYLPETKGRAAAEIDELYERKIPAWRWSNTVTHAEEQMNAAVAQREAALKGNVQEYA